jgi:GNAT superfamily N-acetyltransferase
MTSSTFWPDDFLASDESRIKNSEAAVAVVGGRVVFEAKGKWSVDIRNLMPGDTDAMLQLCAAAGWNQTLADVRRLLTLEPGGCFAAWDAGRVVGTTTTTTYGAELAWVGMVLVDPAFQRRGAATALMGAALDHLRRRGVSTVKLDATPAGRPMYERLGFVSEGQLERWSGEAARADARAAGGTWEDIATADLAAFGVDRGPLLRCVLADSPYPLSVARGEQGELTGYAFTRPGSRATYVGPVIAADLVAARDLLSAALGRVGTGPAFIDVNTDFPGATDLLRELGFGRQRELLRMRLGPDAGVSRSSRVFAIAGPEVG